MCRGNVETGDESYYPKLAKVREVALRPAPGRNGTLYPPAVVSFLIGDVLNRDGSVRYAPQGLEIRRKQSAASIYSQKRRLRDEREMDKSKELQRLLCNKQKKGERPMALVERGLRTLTSLRLRSHRRRCRINRRRVIRSLLQFTLLEPRHGSPSEAVGRPRACLSWAKSLLGAKLVLLKTLAQAAGSLMILGV